MNPLRWRGGRIFALMLVVILMWLIFFTLFGGDSDHVRKDSPSSTLLPSWIETFKLPHEPFVPQNLPILIFSSYRYEYLKKSIGALIDIAKAGDINPLMECTFVLHKTAVTHPDNVTKSMKFVENIDFCKTEIWEYDDHEKKPTAALYNQLWWKVLRRVFPREKPYRGDVFFLEEDAVVSPDVMKVLWYGRRVKNTFGPNIHAVSLGGFSGSNHVNPHPDTLIVRKTFFFQAMAYVFNASFWEFLEPHQHEIANFDEDGDFSEGIAYYMGSYYVNRPLHLVMPTLSRMWHIGKRGLGHWGNYSEEREIQNKPHWESSVRLMKIDTASVNDGIRDGFGFFCEPRNRLFYRSARDNLCRHTLCNFYEERYHGITCIKQPFVTDRCLKLSYNDLEECEKPNLKEKLYQAYVYKFMKQW